eukprot:PhM_4_TR11677/c0_g1_i8/m.13394
MVAFIAIATVSFIGGVFLCLLMYITIRCRYKNPGRQNEPICVATAPSDESNSPSPLSDDDASLMVTMSLDVGGRSNNINVSAKISSSLRRLEESIISSELAVL